METQGIAQTPKKVRVGHLKEFKQQNRKIVCLTSYDSLTANIFDSAGVDVLLVGDSAADNALGYSTTIPITIDEMVPFGRAIAASTTRALTVIDMPFGSYEESPDVALQNAIKLIKNSGCESVKLEGGTRSEAQIRRIVEAGIPVMGHIGFTPQSVNGLSGFKVQGRGEDAQRLIDDALAVQEAGAFAVVLELVPAELAAEISQLLRIPTIGIGAGSGTDGQILVWTDFAGLTGHKPRKFVKRYLELREELSKAAREYADDVRELRFPNAEQSF